MAARQERFVVLETQGEPVNFAYQIGPEDDPVTIFVGQIGRVQVTYLRGDEVVVLDIDDPRMVDAFRSMTKAAIVNGIMRRRLSPEQMGLLIKALKAEDKRQFVNGKWI